MPRRLPLVGGRDLACVVAREVLSNNHLEGEVCFLAEYGVETSRQVGTVVVGNDGDRDDWILDETVRGYCFRVLVNEAQGFVPGEWL